MSVGTVNLTAKPRTAAGKSGANRVRDEGFVPAVAYGKGLTPVTLSVGPKQVAQVLLSERGKNTVVELTVEGGQNLLAMIKDYSLHPVKRSIVHVDFVQVSLDKPVDVDVPLFMTGKAAGLTQGGVMRQVYRTVPVRCLPNQIPLKLEVDVTHLKLGEAVATKDLKLETGVTVQLPEMQTLISVVAPEKDRSEDAAATPAAGAAPAAAAGKDAKAAPAAAAKDAGKDAKKK
jgi:large subunit ribosomal protein L25